MHDKQLTIATYAAGASLAAVTLIYVFAPTYFIDSDSNSARKKGVVGLVNPANDCFINSVLQALAGLTDLRIYLIRETHRRSIDEPWVYHNHLALHPSHRSEPEWKIEGLQAGMVTKGLKEILDALNERPIYKKTISATGFVRCLETAFHQRISRQQQDAQEFLQVVAERLCDEYHAGKTARHHARQAGESADATPSRAPTSAPTQTRTDGENAAENGNENSHYADDKETGKQQTKRVVMTDSGSSSGTEDGGQNNGDATTPERLKVQIGAEVQRHSRYEAYVEDVSEEEEDGFPMEGKIETQIECLTCHFKPRPTTSTFCTLILNVPTGNSTTLNSCLDVFFKTEYIDDFKCEKCRLVHAKDVLQKDLTKFQFKPDSFRDNAEAAIQRIQTAIDTDPETAPKDVVLPDMRVAPKRRIARYTRLVSFPKIMAIHLSRSIYHGNQLSTKNSAKVNFPERLPMGTLLRQKRYRLSAVVTHRGSHHSGHYESFRRQNIVNPYPTSNTFQQSHVFTKSAQPSPANTPQATTPPDVATKVKQESASNSSTTSNASSDHHHHQPGTPPPRKPLEPVPRSSSSSSSSSARPGKDRDSDSLSLRSAAASARSTLSKLSATARNSRSHSPASGNEDCNSTDTTTKKHGPLATISNTIRKPATPPHLSNGTSTGTGTGAGTGKPGKKRKPPAERWWRISDEKIKEAKTSEVLAMQREVYLLFYELDVQRAAMPVVGAGAGTGF